MNIINYYCNILLVKLNMTEFTKFFIQGFEFRKYSHTINDYYIKSVMITINIKLPDLLFSLFCEKDNYNIVNLQNKYTVEIILTDNKVKIINYNPISKSVPNTNIQNCVNEIIYIFEKDMKYLRRKNKLPLKSNHHNFKQHHYDKPPQERYTPIQEPPPLPQRYTPMPEQSLAPSFMPEESPSSIPIGPSTLQENATTYSHSDPNAVFHGLVIVITKPTPKILADLFQNNINYSLMPEMFLPPIYPQMQQQMLMHQQQMQTPM